jgi:hypothetical protein
VVEVEEEGGKVDEEEMTVEKSEIFKIGSSLSNRKYGDMAM